MIVTDQQAQNFEKFINSYDFFFISGHKDPDGDSISSALGVAEILKAKGKHYQLISVGPFKKTEIKKFEKLFISELPKRLLSKPNAALIQVDCSEINRIGNGFCDLLKDYPTFIIDHHKTAEATLDNSIIYADSPAAVFLIQQLYEKLVGKPDKKLAEILFFGICTDTGFFKFLGENTSPVFDGVSRLVSYGANPRKTYSDISSGKPFSTRQLFATVLARTKQYCKGKLLVTYETLEDTQKLGKNGRDTDALYDMLLSTEGAKATIFLRQESETNCTVGFRSKDDIDVSVIAAKFGGGGHKNASGLSIEGKIEDIAPKIIAEFESVFAS